MKNCSILIGRFNPPSIAHQKLIEELIDISKENNLNSVLFIISGVKSSKNRQKNPLNNYEIKYFLNKMFPDLKIIIATSVFDVSEKLKALEYTPRLLLCGEDREKTYSTFFKNYDGFKIIKHDRNFLGMKVSSTIIRNHIKEGTIGVHQYLLPTKMNIKHKITMAKLVKYRMGENYQINR